MAAMFSRDEEMEHTEMSASSGTAQTIIGPSVKVEGTFESDDNILIDGEVMGTIKTTQDLTVGKDAHIEADVSAANMHISGSITGNLHATGMIELASSARIMGDIDTQVISVETGAVIEGRCVAGQGATKMDDGEPAEVSGEDQSVEAVNA